MFQQILWTICRQGVQEVLIELHLENFEAAFQQRDIRSLQDLTKKSSFMRSKEGFVSEKMCYKSFGKLLLLHLNCCYTIYIHFLCIYI